MGQVYRTPHGKAGSRTDIRRAKSVGRGHAGKFHRESVALRMLREHDKIGNPTLAAFGQSLPRGTKHATPESTGAPGRVAGSRSGRDVRDDSGNPTMKLKGQHLKR